MIRAVSSIVLGMLLAFPLSYFFQSSIYHEMSWLQYTTAGTSSLFIGIQFGAVDVYLNTAVATIIGVIILGYGIEWYFTRNKY